MLHFKRDYSGLGRVGMAITSGYETERQRLIDALETVAEAADGNLQVYLEGKPFTLTCRSYQSVVRSTASRSRTLASRCAGGLMNGTRTLMLCP